MPANCFVPPTGRGLRTARLTGQASESERWLARPCGPRLGTRQGERNAWKGVAQAPFYPQGSRVGQEVIDFNGGGKAALGLVGSTIDPQLAPH